MVIVGLPKNSVTGKFNRYRNNSKQPGKYKATKHLQISHAQSEKWLCKFVLDKLLRKSPSSTQCVTKVKINFYKLRSTCH